MPAWLQRDWCSSFVLTLGHFVWQGTLIALALAIALRATRTVSVRYWLSLAALLVMAACPIVTLDWLLQPVSRVATFDATPTVRVEPTPSPLMNPAASIEAASDVGHVSNVPVISAAPPVDFSQTATISPTASADDRSWWQKFAPQLTTTYLCGVALMLLRLVAGLWGGRRLRRRVHMIDDPSLLRAMLQQATALGLKLLPMLAYCERVTVPTVVGVLKPMILLPLTLTSGLSPEQMESVLAHELAHLRRYDHLVNLLQRVIESLLFFHPALWWVSHRIRDEREHCCDDLVVACGTMPLDYAKSLLAVAELSRTSQLRAGRGSPDPALGSVAAVSLLATGTTKPSHLRQRIARLLGESATPSLRVSPRALLLAICIPLVALIMTIQSGAGRGSPDPALDPTAGLPKSDEETNKMSNANGDLRSNSAAGSGDPRRAQDATSPPKGLEFLKPYPKLHGLSLDMTEPQFLEIVKQQELKTRKTLDDEKATHHIALGDDHTLIVMFDKDSKCSGIQRVRGEDNSGRPPELRVLRKPALLLPDHWIVRAVGFDHDGKELVTASNQSFITIRRWDVVGGKLISEIKLQGDKHGRAVRDGTLMFSGDRQRVIAATDAYVGIWETATGKLLKQLPFPTKEGIYTCAIDLLDATPDLSVIVGHRALPGRLTLSFDAHLIVWDGVSGNVLQTVIDKGATDLKAIDLSTDGKRLVTTNGGGAKIWETSTGQLLRFIPNDNTGRKHSEPDVSNQYTSHVWSVQLSPDGQRLAMGDILGVKLLDTTSGKLLQQLEGPYRYSSSQSPPLVFSKDGQWLARLGTQERVISRNASIGEGDKHGYVVPIWSTRTGARLFELHTEANDAAFSDDGQRLAVVFSDMQQALSVWSLGLHSNANPPISRNALASSSENPSTLEPDASAFRLIESLNSGSTAGPGPHSRQDRVEENGHSVGKTAAEFIDKFQPTWSDTKLGLQYGIALTKPKRQFRIGERVPLVVFFRNASDHPIKFDTAPDFFGNTPKVLNAKGEPITLENIPLLGHIPHYHEKLAPGEALGPFYLSFGLGENPRPGQQHWHPSFKTPVAGRYKLTHSASINVASPKEGEPSKRDDITTGTIEFEIFDGDKTATDGD